MTVQNSISQLTKDLQAQMTAQLDKALLHQLGDLVERGLLVVEQRAPVLIQDPMQMYGFQVRTAVKLTLKDKEYIEKLEAENKSLKHKMNVLENLFMESANEEKPQ